jgi:ferredoxin
MPRVTFLPYGISLEVSRGTSLLAAADEAAESVPDDFFVGELCEGRHECGNCVVEIVEGAANLSPVTASEEALL